MNKIQINPIEIINSPIQILTCIEQTIQCRYLNLKLISQFFPILDTMKSDPSTLQKPAPLKKSSKPLNEKKNSIIPQTNLKKQKSKLNLFLNDYSQLSTSNVHKLASPKNPNFPASMLSPKTQPNEDLFKTQKSQLKKTGITNTKLKKAGVSKHEPIKKELLPVMKSPKNGKINTTHSETYLNSQKDHSINFNQESHLTIDLETSILKTQYQTDEIVEDNSILNQSMIPSATLLNQSKIEELSKTSNEQNLQIQRLKQKNQELQRKLMKMKQSQEENRKKLKERISSFNEEGEQMRIIKEKVVELEKQVSTLQNQNIILKNSTQVSQKSSENTKTENTQQTNQPQKNLPNLDYKWGFFSLQISPTSIQNKKQMIDESVMTSFEDEICDGVLSFINGSGSGNFEESLLSNDKIKDSRIQSVNLIPSLQIEAIKNSYEQKYQQKMLQLQTFYKEGLKTIENRYKLLVEETVQIVKSQQSQLISLQTKIDKLYEKLEDCTCSPTSKHTPTMQTDEEKLKHMMEINQYKQKVAKKDEELKQLREDVHLKEIECKKVSSELDIERIRFNLTSETRTVTRQVIELAQKQQVELLMQELKQQKEKTSKLQNQNEKKEELIKKMSVYQNSSNTANKKIKK